MSLKIDSRLVEKGDAFFCIIGNELDGHDYVDDAVKKGASVIIHSEPVEHEVEGVKYIQVEDTVKALNDACEIYFNDVTSEMKIFGVTGTNGKTTITNIIQQIYSEVSPCGYIGTIATRFRDYELEGGLTTPGPITLHESLSRMKKRGAEAVALEVSSQGLCMGRVDAVKFDYAIFTNLTHDHLDDHKSMEQYFEAKKTLFRGLSEDAKAVINNDSFTADGLRECTKAGIITYGIKNDADYRAENVRCTSKKSYFDLHIGEKVYPVETNLLGEYNVYNLLGAIAALHDAGTPIEVILEKSKHISQVAGRAEPIDEGQDFDVVVDYAHTPDGYEKFLGFLRKTVEPPARLIVVFGCAGKRDQTKRSEMGEIADKYADRIFLTEQDTRNSDVNQIVSMILEGIKEREKVSFNPIRKDAIREAIESARAGDCIAILGKGDESYMYGKDGKLPYEGDNNVARSCLKELMGRK